VSAAPSVQIGEPSTHSMQQNWSLCMLTNHIVLLLSGWGGHSQISKTSCTHRRRYNTFKQCSASSHCSDS